MFFVSNYRITKTNYNSFKGYKDKDSIYFPLVLKDEDISVLTEDVAKKIRKKGTNVFQNLTLNQIRTLKTENAAVVQENTLKTQRLQVRKIIFISNQKRPQFIKILYLSLYHVFRSKFYRDGSFKFEFS